MVEPEGREDEIGDTDAGPLSADAAMVEGSAADPAPRKSVPAFRARGGAAGDLSLDLAAAADEPEQLVRMLIVAATEHINYSENEEKWKVILGHLDKASKELERLNMPMSHRGAKFGSL
jgi:hypothetical protein